MSLLDNSIYNALDLFNIPSFSRNALILFRNSSTPKSNHDLSSYITKYGGDIYLSWNDTINAIERMDTIEHIQNDRSSIDIVTIYSRLYDHDTDLEQDWSDKLNSYLEENNLKFENIYLEYKDEFVYNWCSKIKFDSNNIFLSWKYESLV